MNCRARKSSEKFLKSCKGQIGACEGGGVIANGKDALCCEQVRSVRSRTACLPLLTFTDNHIITLIRAITFRESHAYNSEGTIASENHIEAIPIGCTVGRKSLSPLLRSLQVSETVSYPRRVIRHSENKRR